VADVTGGKKVTAVNNESAIGAKMRYTTTGVDPVSTDSEWPTAGVTLDTAGTTTFKVASFVGTSKGSVATKAVTVEKLTAPTITAGDNSFTIEGGDAEIEADLYYRFGSSGSWTKYTAAVAITETVTVNAYAKLKGYVDSDTASQEVEYTEPEE
jgi:hypothetical protein